MPPKSDRLAPDDSPAIDTAAVLLTEEVARVRVFFRVILTISLMVEAFLPFLPGKQWIRMAVGAMLLVVSTLCATLLIVLRVEKRYTPRLITPIGIIFAVLG